MIKAGIDNAWLDPDKVILESLMSFKRLTSRVMALHQLLRAGNQADGVEILHVEIGSVARCRLI